MFTELRALQGYKKSKTSLLIRDIQICLAPFFLFLCSLFCQMVATTVAGDLNHFAIPSYCRKVPVKFLFHFHYIASAQFLKTILKIAVSCLYSPHFVRLHYLWL